MDEEFRNIDGYPAYRISNLGRIQTRWRWGAFYCGYECEDVWKDLPTHPDAKGYPQVHLADGRSKPKTLRVHRLVALAFHNIPSGAGKLVVRHLDGDPANNRADNLAWGTYTQNEHDKHRHGTFNTRMGGASLTEYDVKQIRRLAFEGVSQVELAARFKVSRPTITRIVNRTIWKDI